MSRISLADRDESVAEAVELRLGLGLGGLNHERTGDRPRHRRRVETVVHQALRDVRPSTPVASLIGRMSRMNSCAHVPFSPLKSTG